MEIVPITNNKGDNSVETAEIIELLKDALSAAKLGTYQSLVIVAVQTNGAVSDGIAGDITSNHTGLQGGLVNVTYSIARHRPRQ